MPSLGGDRSVDGVAVLPLFRPQVRRGAVRASLPVRRRRSVGPGEHLGGGAVQLEGGEPCRDGEPVPTQQSKVRVDRCEDRLMECRATLAHKGILKKIISLNGGPYAQKAESLP